MCGSVDPIAPIDNAGLAERIQKNMRGITPPNGAPCERMGIKRTMERRNITRLIPPKKNVTKLRGGKKIGGWGK